MTGPQFIMKTGPNRDSQLWFCSSHSIVKRGSQNFKGELSGPDSMGTQIWEVAMNVFHSVVATLCPTKQGTPTFKKGPYLTRYKGVPNMNSFLHLHEFWALIHSFIPKHICQWFQNGNLKCVQHPDIYVSTRRFQLQAISILQLDTRQV